MPFFEEELILLYKESKKKALLIFNKVAVGTVKDEYLAGLKEKMNAKLQTFRIENEKTSEQFCLMFLQQNYEAIA